ncbi:MAG: hypothetical protein HOV76_31205, partial [Hamadaea sp.]|nr:hypothetical protein [Hamadaea sp.]
MPQTILAWVGLRGLDRRPVMTEFHLLDEPTTSDLAAKVTQAWRDFAGA